MADSFMQALDAVGHHGRTELLKVLVGSNRKWGIVLQYI